MPDATPEAPTAAAHDTARAEARARAAGLLGIAPEAVEEDLLDFLTTGETDALLRARAGSGKTTALVLKVAHLVLDRGVDPAEIMMLAFNNAAARTLEARLADFGVPEGVRVRTFHAFGQRIVRAHFGPSRRPVFDETSDDGRAVARIMQDALDEVAGEKFYLFCAARMRTNYRKRREYVDSIGREALLSAANFLRARGYGLQNRLQDAWGHSPIAGNAMKTILAYEGELKANRLLDATSVIQAAAWTLEREIETGASRHSDAHGIGWIFIDEFQDVSQPYMRLVAAMRRLNGFLTIQGVGDDWQAINGFAGADATYFAHPADHLEQPRQLDLLRNRRSGADIVAWGNDVMARAGYPDAPAVPHPGNGAGEVARTRVGAARDLRFIAERLAALIDPEAGEAALIARKWKIGDHALAELRSLVAAALQEKGHRGRIAGITAHGAKGLEYDQVLLLDDGSFPLEHPSRPILEALIPADAHLREEACLKHVAGTRARHRLDLVDMR